MTKRKKILSVAFAMVAVFIWFALNGVNKSIEKTVVVNVYEDSMSPYLSSSITISGNIKKTLFSTNFVGTFAMEYYESSCREGTQAKIEWFDDYQNIMFYYLGDFSRLDIDLIEIDEKMEDIMVVFNDGLIIATPNHNIPERIWTKYKN